MIKKQEKIRFYFKYQRKKKAVCWRCGKIRITIKELKDYIDKVCFKCYVKTFEKNKETGWSQTIYPVWLKLNYNPLVKKLRKTKQNTKGRKNA